MKRTIHLLTCVGLLAFGLWSCEEEFIPPVIDVEEQIVVEGYIEAGDRPTPPYVFLTRSFPFFSEFSPDQLNELYVNDAVVTVSDGEKEVTLTEFCLDDIPAAFRDQAADFLGVDIDSIGFNFCVYLDITGSILGEEGKTYTLQIDAEGKQLSAVTSIPAAVPLNTLFFEPPPGEPNDTLARLLAVISDPAGEANYYRYFTQIGDGPFLRPPFSVTDDLLFDGQEFEFPLDRALAPGEEFDQSTFGLFTVGDTVTIKSINMDQAHFDFWNTLEFSRANQGPFSSYTRIDHNIEGGIGIWGGMNARYYELIVEL